MAERRKAWLKGTTGERSFRNPTGSDAENWSSTKTSVTRPRRDSDNWSTLADVGDQEDLGVVGKPISRSIIQASAADRTEKAKEKARKKAVADRYAAAAARNKPAADRICTHWSCTLKTMLPVEIRPRQRHANGKRIKFDDEDDKKRLGWTWWEDMLLEALAKLSETTSGDMAGAHDKLVEQVKYRQQNPANEDHYSREVLVSDVAIVTVEFKNLKAAGRYKPQPRSSSPETEHQYLVESNIAAQSLGDSKESAGMSNLKILPIRERSKQPYIDRDIELPADTSTAFPTLPIRAKQSARLGADRGPEGDISAHPPSYSTLKRKREASELPIHKRVEGSGGNSLNADSEDEVEKEGHDRMSINE